jgi:hypothetical protein
MNVGLKAPTPEPFVVTGVLPRYAALPPPPHPLAA